MNRIYLDHAATTYLDDAVKAAMEPYWQDKFGNASTIYKEGCDARSALNAARKNIASLIGANPDEIIFINGGTESDNLAIFGIAGQFKGGHIITTKIEHHAVLNSCKALEKKGFKVTYLEAGKKGIIDVKEFKKVLRKDTVLVSIMYANNEIGTIQPIKEIVKAIRDYKTKNKNQKIYFHTDAIQAAGYLDLNVEKLGIDLMSVNASKIYGPKGIGFLYVRRGVKLLPIIYGGGQERGMRSGTENIPSIVGLSKAFEIAQKMCEKESKRVAALRDYLIRNILKIIPESMLNGSQMSRLPNNVNVTIKGVEGESLVLYLDAHGIACSTGSACTSQDLNPSHVIIALGKSREDAHCSIRFTLGRKTTKDNIDYLLKVLPGTVKKLRNISAIK